MREVRFISVLDEWLYHLYEHLGSGVKLSLFWVLFSLPIVTIPAATSALSHAVLKLFRHGNADFRTFLEGFKKYSITISAIFCFFFVILGILLCINIPFYMFYVGKAGNVLCVMSIWSAILVIVGGIYIVPLLVRGNNARSAVRYSYLFFFMHPVFTLLIALVLFLLAVLSVSLVIPWFLITPYILILLVESGCSKIIAFHGNKDKIPSDSRDGLTITRILK